MVQMVSAFDVALLVQSPELFFLQKYNEPVILVEQNKIVLIRAWSECRLEIPSSPRMVLPQDLTVWLGWFCDERV
jgi:hypothetical protein